MPRAHRDNDERFCGAKTIVNGQSSVYVNNKLWAVEGDIDDHCGMGELIAVVGRTIYIENKLIICAVGDTAEPDLEDCIVIHPKGATAPKNGSPNTFAYEGGTGGGTVT